ncbi:MAG: hypothetical protein K2Y21_15260 [Phycisphaerales bacterium]|nr:hypothetical protein [Phycisphaerales bacterium]
MAGLLIAMGLLVVAIGIATGVMTRRAELVPGTTVCRGCKFDLATHFSDARVPQSFACPECGRAVQGLADTSNRRVKKPVHRLFVFLVTVLGLLATGSGVAMKAPTTNLNRFKPLWLLHFELFQATPKVQSAAAKEVASRLSSGSVSRQDFDPIFNTIAKLQTDSSVLWNKSWAELVLAADSAGLVSPQQLATVAKQGTKKSLVTRKRVRVGTAIPLKIVRESDRAMSGSSSLSLVQRARFVQSQILGDTPRLHGISSENTAWESGKGWTSFLGPTARKVGPIRVTVIAQHEIAVSGSKQPLLAWEQTLTADMICVGADEPIIEEVCDDSLAPRIQSSIRISRLSRAGAGGRSAMFDINISSLPINFAADILVRCADGYGSLPERNIGTLVLAAGADGSYGQSTQMPAEFPCMTVDVVLRPSMKAAEQSPDLESVWMGPDIVIRNVPVSEDH